MGPTRRRGNDAMKIVLKLIYTFLLLILAGIFALIASETYYYLARSEASAKSVAEVQFRILCAQLGFDPASFTGPTRPYDTIDAGATQYNFTWSRPPDEEIVISVTYFPYHVEGTVIGARILNH